MQAFGQPTDAYPDGVPIPSRYNDLYPEKDYGDGCVSRILQFGVAEKQCEIEQAQFVDAWRYWWMLACDRYLQLSVQDIMNGAGLTLDEINDEKARLFCDVTRDTILRPTFAVLHSTQPSQCIRSSPQLQAMVRLSGVEIVAKIDIKNYNIPYRHAKDGHPRI